jgi:hypothetical protein
VHSIYFGQIKLKDKNSFINEEGGKDNPAGNS